MKSISCLFIALLWSLNAQAALVSGNIIGFVNSADVGNVFGLTAGDTIELDVVFEDSVLTGSGGETVFFNLPGNTMTFNVGSLSFTEGMDTAGGVGPTLSFFDGALSEIKYDTQFDTFGVFFSSIDFFQGSDDAGNFIGGDWDLSTYSASPVVVPVPAAIWLMMSGLIVLFRFQKKQKTMRA